MAILSRLADTATRLRAVARRVAAGAQPSFVGRPLPGSGFEVVAVHPHDATAWTQGLAWADGALFESTGLIGRSSLREVDLETGRIRRIRRLPERHFGEGLAAVGDRLIQLTWRSGCALVWDRSTFEPIGEIPLSGEVWGLTSDGGELVMSDGSARLRRLDATSLARLGEIEVRCDGRPVEGLNDLAIANGEILAVQHPYDRIARVSADGSVVGWIDLAPLRRLPGLRGREQVANGIAWDAAAARLLVTGKRWPRLFAIAPSGGPAGSGRTAADGSDLPA